MNTIKKYLGKEVVFDSNGYINATKTAKQFGKKGLDNLMRSEPFKKYMKAVSNYRNVDLTELKKTIKGRNIEQGTFLHPYLVVEFARWLSIDFAVWCNMVIEDILTGKATLEYKEKYEAQKKANTALHSFIDSDDIFDKWEQSRLDIMADYSNADEFNNPFD